MATKKSSVPEVVTMSDKELSSLQDRIQSGDINQVDRALLISVLETMRLLYKTVKKANTTIGTLRRWFGFKKTERKPQSNDDKNDSVSHNNHAQITEGQNPNTNDHCSDSENIEKKSLKIVTQMPTMVGRAQKITRDVLKK